MLTPHYLTSLSELANRSSLVVAGVMSGTSVDSVDVGICRIEDAPSPAPSTAQSRAKVTLEGFYRHPYPLPLRSRVLKSRDLNVQDVAELNVLIGQLFAEAIEAARLEWGGGTIDLIGSHGQTIYHHSGIADKIPATLQIGCGDIIASKTGIFTIFNFRAKDVAVGGEGAPLVPYADEQLFWGDGCRAVVNLGGIANITLLGLPEGKVLGFDTGPANAPLDRIARKITQGVSELDYNGLLATQGSINAQLLSELLADPYLARMPPKSTGPEMYGDEFVEGVIRRFGRVDNDLIATMTEFVAISVAQAIITSSPEPVTQVVVAGGGANNPFLMNRMQVHLGSIPVLRSDECGVPAYAREVMAFALLAYDALRGRATSKPSVTGGSRPVRLGCFAFPD